MRNPNGRRLGIVCLGFALAACGGGGGDEDTGTHDTPPDTADVVPDDGADGPADAAPDEPDVLPEDAADVDDATDETDAPPIVGECRNDSPEGLMGCVQTARLTADLEAIVGDRSPGSTLWQAAQDLCASTFTTLGYTVERHDYGTGLNVIGVREGAEPSAGRVLVSAHYDGVPGCPDADDNASGVAGVLEVARVLSTASFRRTTVLACWDEEEDGLLGSEAYAQRAFAAGENILVSLVFEMIGYADDTPGAQTLPEGIGALFPEQLAWVEARENRGDFIAVISDDLSRTAHTALSYYAPAVALPIVVMEVPAWIKDSPLIGDLRRSDHASFWDVDIPSLFITDTSEFRNPHYHCGSGDDSADTLDPVFGTKVVQTTVGAAASLLELR
jgi:hypothetical protein